MLCSKLHLEEKCKTSFIFLRHYTYTEVFNYLVSAFLRSISGFVSCHGFLLVLLKSWNGNIHHELCGLCQLLFLSVRLLQCNSQVLQFLSAACEAGSRDPRVCACQTFSEEQNSVSVFLTL